MNKILHTATVVEKRKKRVRAKLHGTAARPRVSAFRSNRYMYLQAINDDAGVVVASAHDHGMRSTLKSGETLTKSQGAIKAAESLSAQLLKKKVTAAVMDRGAYKYHGRVKAVAETLRAQGIQV